MGPIVDLISVELDEQPIEEPGLVRKLDEDYFKKIEAIEFAVKYDDGRDPRGILTSGYRSCRRFKDIQNAIITILGP